MKNIKKWFNNKIHLNNMNNLIWIVILIKNIVKFNLIAIASFSKIKNIKKMKFLTFNNKIN